MAPPRTDVRARLLDAVVQVAARDGLSAVTPDAVAAAAEMPRESFDEQFDDAVECLLAAYEVWLDRASQAFAGAALSDRLGALFGCIAARPDVARACLVEVPAAGPQGRLAREAAVDRLRAALARDAEAPPIALRVAAGGIYQVAQHSAREGTTERLPSLAPELARVWGRVLDVAAGQADHDGAA
jgi:AcrR family transcriptional regulator